MVDILSGIILRNLERILLKEHNVVVLQND